MKLFKKAGAAFVAALFMTAMTVLTSGISPVKVAAVSNEVPDPVVRYETVPETVTAGNPFEATFHFSHDLDEADFDENDISEIRIKVSSPNGAIRLGESSYTLDGTGAGDDDNEAFHVQGSGYVYYDLHIPEKNLKYIGPASGTLRFTVTYYDSNNRKIKDGSFAVQKTVVFASGNADSTILVDENATTPTIQAGTTGVVGIPLVSSSAASDVQINVTLPADVKIKSNSAGSTYKMSFSSGERKNLNLNLEVDPSVPAGVYPVTLSIDGQTVTAYIRVTDSTAGNGKLVVQSYKLDRNSVDSGSIFKMDIVLKNNSGQVYHNVIVTVGGLSTEGITMNNTLDSKSVANIPAGGTATVSFPLKAASKMATGNYILDITLAADELETPVTSKAFVNVIGGGDASSGKPVVIIESYDFGGMNITGGKVFTLTMTFKNASPAVAIQNMKITVSSAADEDTGGVFTPANSSNTFFIENLGPRAAITKTIDLYPKADAKPKSYGLDVKFDYESASDSEHTALTATETISIPLTQPDRFEVTDAEVYGPINLGDQGQFTANFVNKGKSTIFNLSVKLDGNFTSADMSSYIGNVESGNSDSFDTSLTPNEEGMLQGTATFTYEDANGETKEIVKEFSCEVIAWQDPGIMDPGMEDPGMMDPGMEEGQGGFPKWAVWVLILVGVAGAIVAFIFIRKKMKAKRQRLLEEEDEYEENPFEIDESDPASRQGQEREEVKK